jgi:hypothetical protein
MLDRFVNAFVLSRRTHLFEESQGRVEFNRATGSHEQLPFLLGPPMCHYQRDSARRRSARR